MKLPYGKCQYCGQEYMRRQSLENHVLNCKHKPQKKPVSWKESFHVYDKGKQRRTIWVPDR